MPHLQVKNKRPREENEILEAARIAEDLERSLQEKEKGKEEIPVPEPLNQKYRSPFGRREA